MSSITPRSNCPYCGKKLNRASDIDGDEGPKPGDLTICFGCACLMAFDDDLRVRGLTLEELQRFLADPQLMQTVLRTMAEVRAVRSVTSQN